MPSKKHAHRRGGEDDAHSPRRRQSDRRTPKHVPTEPSETASVSNIESIDFTSNARMRAAGFKERRPPSTKARDHSAAPVEYTVNDWQTSSSTRKGKGPAYPSHTRRDAPKRGGGAGEKPWKGRDKPWLDGLETYLDTTDTDSVCTETGGNGDYDEWDNPVPVPMPVPEPRSALHAPTVSEPDTTASGVADPSGTQDQGPAPREDEEEPDPETASDGSGVATPRPSSPTGVPEYGDPHLQTFEHLHIHEDPPLFSDDASTLARPQSDVWVFPGIVQNRPPQGSDPPHHPAQQSFHLPAECFPASQAAAPSSDSDMPQIGSTAASNNGKAVAARHFAVLPRQSPHRGQAPTTADLGDVPQRFIHDSPFPVFSLTYRPPPPPPPPPPETDTSVPQLNVGYLVGPTAQQAFGYPQMAVNEPQQFQFPSLEESSFDTGASLVHLPDAFNMGESSYAVNRRSAVDPDTVSGWDGAYVRPSWGSGSATTWPIAIDLPSGAIPDMGSHAALVPATYMTLAQDTGEGVIPSDVPYDTQFGENCAPFDDKYGEDTSYTAAFCHQVVPYTRNEYSTFASAAASNHAEQPFSTSDGYGTYAGADDGADGGPLGVADIAATAGFPGTGDFRDPDGYMGESALGMALEDQYAYDEVYVEGCYQPTSMGPASRRSTGSYARARAVVDRQTAAAYRSRDKASRVHTSDFGNGLGAVVLGTGEVQRGGRDGTRYKVVR